jgi:circadian clock protein KaiB
MNAVPTNNHKDAPYVLRLYVAGGTSQSSSAINTLKTVCETHLKDRYALTVVDLYERKDCASSNNIQVSPTLVRQWPLPERRFVGGLSDAERVISALNLSPA